MYLMQHINRSLDAQGIFYILKLMLRGAAESFALELPALDTMVYDGRLLPAENINRLLEIHVQFFQQLQLRKEFLASVSQEMRSIMEHIQQNYADYNLSAASVAQAVGCSERRIYTIVKEQTGQTLNEYILALRMNRVGELLLNSKKSTDEIATQCGYQVESTFYRAFKRYYGTTPAQFRKLGGVSPQPGGSPK